MKNLVKMGALLAFAVVGGGCAMVNGGNGNITGFLYQGYKMGGNVGPGQGTKTGQACASSILGIIGTGDASLSAAKAAGGITQVAHVDHDNFGILGIYASTCTVVVGQ